MDANGDRACEWLGIGKRQYLAADELNHVAIGIEAETALEMRNTNAGDPILGEETEIRERVCSAHLSQKLSRLHEARKFSLCSHIKRLTKCLSERLLHIGTLLFNHIDDERCLTK